MRVALKFFVRFREGVQHSLHTAWRCCGMRVSRQFTYLSTPSLYSANDMTASSGRCTLLFLNVAVSMPHGVCCMPCVNTPARFRLRGSVLHAFRVLMRT